MAEKIEETIEDYINDAVGRTAQIMAAKRAIETERSEGLFADPFADRLAGAELASLKKRWQQKYGSNLEDLAKSLARFVAVRTRFFDDFLMSSGNLRQVVILGAGMDARAFRLPWPPGTRLYEVEKPEVMAKKNALLQDATPKSDRRAIGADLTDPAWSEELLKAGYQVSLPSVWLLEGLLMYLDEIQVRCLLETITRLSAAGSCLGADLISVKSAQVGREKGGRVGGHWRFGTDEPERLFEYYGWQASVVQTGDEEANFGRYTKKPPPRSEKNLRRSFLAIARYSSQPYDFAQDMLSAFSSQQESRSKADL